MKNEKPQCVKCTVRRCSAALPAWAGVEKTYEQGKKVPPSCPTERYPDLIKDAIEKYKLPENMAVNIAYKEVSGKVYNPDKPRERWSWTRIEEIMEYARARGMQSLGIATCFGMLYESRLLSDILEAKGFDVVSVVCLCGEIDPKDVDLKGDIMCNPIMQAEVLNREKTELNIMMGLCVGHDVLFIKHCKGEVTPLGVRDNALGNNPLAALYLSQGRYKSRFL